MLSFCAEFPVNARKSRPDFIEAVSYWILNSPHFNFDAADLEGISSENEFKITKGRQIIQSISADFDGRVYAGIRHMSLDGDIIWTTELGYAKEDREAWVGVRTSREANRTVTALPHARKPVVVKTLLEMIGGDYDGEMVVSSSPHRLTGSQVDIATRLIRGEAGCHLPMVYLSCDFKSQHALDAGSLASDLAGMAHVVSEPDRYFSRRLQLNVDSENVYGGIIGVYWPDASGRRSYFRPQSYDKKSDLKSDIIDEIRSSLLNRRPLYRCTWSAAQEALSKTAYSTLVASGSRELDQYVDSFDREMAAVKEKLAAAEKEIQRLGREVQRAESHSSSGSMFALKFGAEQEMFTGEALDIVLDAIAEALQRSMTSSRRQHVLQSISGANPRVGQADVIRNTLKGTLRGYTTMTRDVRSALENLGFDITEDGKHFKLIFRGDDRYVFSLSKTGSDHRAGLNLASDIAKRIV